MLHNTGISGQCSGTSVKDNWNIHHGGFCIDYFFSVLEIKPSALHVLGRYASAELSPVPSVF